MGRPFLLVAIGASAMVLLAVAAAMFWIERPTKLTVAVSKADADDLALMSGAAKLLKTGRHEIRLQLLPVENSAAAAAAVGDDQADLAVVRTDIAMPDKGQTVVILHRDAAIIVAPPASDVHDIGDLAGHRLGIVRNGPGNERLLKTILAQTDIPASAVTVEGLDSEDVAEAVRTKRVDAVMAVDVVAGSFMRDVVTAVTEGGGAPPVFLPVAEADAIAQRSPAYDRTEIVRGAFGGKPPRPAEEFDTLSVTHRLVASEAIAQGPIAALTRFLLTERPALVALAPIARRMEAPPTDKGAVLPIHAGTAAYIDDDEETFFDKYSDAIYIGAMLLGVLASGATAVLGRLNSQSAHSLDASIARLVNMLAVARTAPSVALLDALQGEADGILASAIDRRGIGADDKLLIVFGLVLDQLRTAIRDRRRALAGGLALTSDGHGAFQRVV